MGAHHIVKPAEVRRVEIGFRTTAGSFAEPPAYDWNVQHRGGRYLREEDEAAVWLGDENLADVNAVVHYRIDDPVAALFHVGRLPTTTGLDAGLMASPGGGEKWDEVVRAVAEAALRAEASGRTIESILGSERQDIEKAVRKRVADELERYQSGLAVERVCLGDVHPPLDVVPAFRDVASAAEEKEAQINDAQAYQYETHALAEAQAQEKVLSAEGFQKDRTERAAGSAQRFTKLAAAYEKVPEVTRLRLYLQTVEESLAGRRKVIFDRAADGARRQLFLGPKGLWGLSPPAAAEPLKSQGSAIQPPFAEIPE
jgi:regulator of protease activity HflC (stomatin/prohibitin superfamily)